MRKALIAGACLAAACTPNKAQPEVAQVEAVSASGGFVSRDHGATTLPPETTTTVPAATTTTKVVEVTTTHYHPVITTTSVLRGAPLAKEQTAGASSSSTQLASIRACESRGDYTANTGNGYYGAYQFHPGTWASVGGSGNPANASPAEQDMRAQMMIDAGRRGEWPNC